MTDNDPITLKDAARHFGLTVSTLRAEGRRGRLTLYMIGKRLYTTPADVRVMVDLCRVEPKGRDFTLTRSAGNGSFATDPALSALHAVNETLRRLKSSSRNTSAESTDRSRRTLP